ncbi:MULTISPECIES: ribose 5-phosphate isomerase B [Clostridia]|uniref:Ribose 5-phosphate isomerase B n=2 Tax=Clostridia TaxID=186801 RepID=A0AAQ1MB10_9FIRM|nr:MULTISPECIES: ribose 5-phosphate isomerase B [Clostridia]ERI98663.1 ribose-5-phosphate isomerase B [Clostridium sp. ATCC 29733]MZL68583.1 ribose 5-phosphate isomerase B [Bittarella massiliensis (ex Durand et al. 2017)]MZL79362.1 ribose 5-phosphate isomerase B [Bittarella massiliensis (ex Durand et al. 2017)]SHF65937.1 ribose 5-phosphate isomerase B [Bittarella massiliensis (ex Durand et al. 2017)]
MLAIGCDHGGYALKEEVKKHLDERGIEYIDCGCNGESVDYPVIASETCAHITSGECERGLLFCGTGIGISIAANKTPGIRAACCSDYYSAKYTRMHNDANVLCMGGRVISSGLACELVDVFLDTAYEGGRHQRRVDMLTELDKKKQ